MPKSLATSVKFSTYVQPEELIQECDAHELKSLLDAIINNGKLEIREIRDFVNAPSYDDPGKPEATIPLHTVND